MATLAGLERIVTGDSRKALAALPPESGPIVLVPALLRGQAV